MNLFFQILLLILSLGGVLVLASVYEEYDKRLMIGVLFLFCIMGVVIAIWGTLLHFNNSVLFSIGKGPIYGWQLMVVGIILALFTGSFGVKELIKNNKTT